MPPEITDNVDVRVEAIQVTCFRDAAIAVALAAGGLRPLCPHPELAEVLRLVYALSVERNMLEDELHWARMRLASIKDISTL